MFTQINPNFPNPQSLTNSIIMITNHFMQTIKQITPKIDVCYLRVDEWTDKVKRNFLGIAPQGLINDKFDKKVVCFKKN